MTTQTPASLMPTTPPELAALAAGLLTATAAVLVIAWRSFA